MFMQIYLNSRQATVPNKNGANSSYNLVSQEINTLYEKMKSVKLLNLELFSTLT